MNLFILGCLISSTIATLMLFAACVVAARADRSRNLSFPESYGGIDTVSSTFPNGVSLQDVAQNMI